MCGKSARRLAPLEYEDEDTGMRIKRLWSFRDREAGVRYYADILEMPQSGERMSCQLKPMMTTESMVGMKIIVR